MKATAVAALPFLLLPATIANAADSPALRHSPPACVAVGNVTRVSLGIADYPAGVARVSLFFRSSGMRDWYWVSMSFDGLEYAAWLPPVAAGTAAVSYYLQVIGRDYEIHRTPDYGVAVSRQEDCTLDPTSTWKDQAVVVHATLPDQPYPPPGFMLHENFRYEPLGDGG